jgi:hypothetical protein
VFGFENNGLINFLKIFALQQLLSLLWYLLWYFLLRRHHAMAQSGRGKARKISNDMVTDSDGNNDLGNDGSEGQPAVVLSDSDSDDLPAIVTIGRDAPTGPSQRGIKRKSTELSTRKAATVSRTFSSCSLIGGYKLTILADKTPEPLKVTYHLKIAQSSEPKKQPSKRTNMARILKVAQSLTIEEHQDAIVEIVADALQLSTLIFTYDDFDVLFTVARKVSDPTPLRSAEDYEILIDNVKSMKDPAVSLFICALKVRFLQILA